VKPAEQPGPVTVRILDKEFLIACAPEERPALLSSARYLDERMREVRDGARIVGLDRISIMAGLNIANELLQQQARNEHLDRATLPRIAALQARMQGILDQHRNGRIDF
jgi:cell division protein ZapA